MKMNPHESLKIPDSLRTQLLEYRRRLWSLKIIEAVCGAVIGVLVGFFIVFTLDRFYDTTPLLRLVIFATAMACCGLIPVAIERWVLKRRRLDQLARLLRRTHPNVGDQLLGIIELAGNRGEQSRSPALANAAIRQVSHDIAGRDLSGAIPNLHYKRRLLVAGGLVTLALVAFGLTGAAAKNAWQRFLTPWSDTPRYTFADVNPLPATFVVPQGEPFDLAVHLTPDSRWQPESAELSIPGTGPLLADRKDLGYEFELPPQIQSSELKVTVGDYRGATRLAPKMRPELNDLQAEIRLPAYLGRQAKLRQDILGGALTAVKGSTAVVRATASRTLTAATVDARPRTPVAQSFDTDPVNVDAVTEVELGWVDEFGLSGREPFRLSVEAIEDRPPIITCESMPRRKVILDSEVIKFRVRAGDDFGVRRVGLEWQGVDPQVDSPAAGESMLGLGNSQAESLELAATFSAKQFGISPQPVAVRVFVEDFLPGRPRVYSPTCLFNVLNPEQHAAWITDQLSRWHRMALDVHDREKQLYQNNKAFRELPADQLDAPETRQRLLAQASAERSNARRLKKLTSLGDDLLTEAMRNKEIGVGHLDAWAEMMRSLKDISGNRMPSVADLLKAASSSEKAASPKNASRRPQVGQNRLTTPPSSQAAKPEAEKNAAPVPAITDVESSHNRDEEAAPPGPPKKPKKSRLTLPTTMLAGNGSPAKKKPTPAQEKTDDAVREQKDLLAEFEKVANELSDILANLEGSTLVKRLKAASRKQQEISGKLVTDVATAFGSNPRSNEGDDGYVELTKIQTQTSRDAALIMDDMAAYFQRSRYTRFRTVLEDMRKQDVSRALDDLAKDLATENGLSISQAEYWSDTLDRWAEDLVEVTKCGACPGCKSKGSLPPSIVLEVLQVLECEVDLREQTRVAQQSKPAVTPEEHHDTADDLSDAQDELRKRIDAVVIRIGELPDAAADFGKELQLLTKVGDVMDEATGILAKPETGGPAIAVETEAIELLLQSKRFNPKGGGGGGTNPGGGGSGDTQASALALVGAGVNAKEVRQEPAAVQVAGATGGGLPEEFRSGLDEYFNRIETWQEK